MRPVTQSSAARPMVRAPDMTKTSLLGRLLGLYGTACARLAHLNFLAPLLGRIVIAAVCIPSGWGKRHSLTKVIDFFTSLGIPFPLRCRYRSCGRDASCELPSLREHGVV